MTNERWLKSNNFECIRAVGVHKITYLALRILRNELFVMRKPSNPFIVSGYHSPFYFCDRQAELAWLVEQFENERNAVLYSWRRMGKTALLKHFFYHLEQKNMGEGVFVDLLGTINLQEANRRIASAIVQRFGETNAGLGTRLLKLVGAIGATIGIDPMSGTPQVTFGLSNSQSIPASFEAIGKFLEERKRTVVICIDEFQQIVSYEENNAEAVFRTWMQNFPMIRFVFSGSHRGMMTSMFSEESRPFYRSAQLKALDPLKPEDYTRFIETHFSKAGKKITGVHIEKIFRWTRMQTYYAQLICNKLFSKSDVVSENLFNEACSEILQQEIPVFSTYQQLLTAFQWKLLVALARYEDVTNPLSQEFLNQNALGAASSVSAALRTLEKKDFVIYENNRYTLHDTLLMRWLQTI
jgi:AAA+ ATPase superfamily predicted ATPase